MRRISVLLALLAAPAFAHDDTLIPMPMDIPPHHVGSIVGDHHYDIKYEDFEEEHGPTHWISYGQHNYDMSQEPYNRDRYDHDQRRYRGMGEGPRERYSLTRRTVEDIDDHAEQPWVLDRIHHRGLAYAMPPEEAHDEMHNRAVGFPRPSWYAIYKKDRRVHRE